MAEYRHLANPNPEWTHFPDNLPKATDVVEMSRAHDPITPQDGLTIDEFTIPMRDAHDLCVRRYRKTALTDKIPLFIYMHGGGYVTGGLETDDVSLRKVASQLDVAVLSIEYRLAPEHTFPVGFEDSYQVVKWAASQEGQDKLNVDLAKGFILGGTSAGGNFTSGIAHLAHLDHVSPPLTGVVFLASNFCHPDARPARYLERILSVDEVVDAPGLNRNSIDYFGKKYGGPAHDKRVSSLLFDSHAGIAQKAYFAVCGWDPRRDEAILFEQLLKEAGLETKIDIYAGLPHGFWTTCPNLPVSKKWLEDLVAGLKWMLE